jgi:hypothetical protein
MFFISVFIEAAPSPYTNLYFFLLEMCVAPAESMKIIRIIIILDAVPSLIYM